MKKALITGVSGQDGSYLADFLLEKNYTVHVVVRRTSTVTRSRLEHLFSDPSVYNKRIFFHYADLGDIGSLRRIFNQVSPDEVYHLAGQSHVGLSFEIPEITSHEAGFSIIPILELIRESDSRVRFFHASSSEIFGNAETSPQSENSPFRPVNPYGAAKAFATNMTRIYRDAYSLFLVNGIMYGHDSPRRGENFVIRKICKAVAGIASGALEELALGNLDVQRDWGHAKDYVEGMWLSLQHTVPDDYVFSSGTLRSLIDVLEVAFRSVGLNWHDHVVQDKKFLRLVEPNLLVGDSSKARAILGWQRRHTFEELIKEMVLSELANAPR
jgi:GDPmannose 4,6-dehydratase